MTIDTLLIVTTLRKAYGLSFDVYRHYEKDAYCISLRNANSYYSSLIETRELFNSKTFLMRTFTKHAEGLVMCSRIGIALNNRVALSPLLRTIYGI